jgi:hypothetical protein
MRTVFAAAFLLFASSTVTQAQQVAVHPPDGSYIYNWTQGGAVAGQSTVVFKSSAGHVTMRTDTNLPGVQLAGATILYGSGRLEFQSYNGFATTNGQNTSIDLKLVNGSVVGTTTNQSVVNNVNVSQLASVPAIAVDDGTMGTFLRQQLSAHTDRERNFRLRAVLDLVGGSVSVRRSDQRRHRVVRRQHHALVQSDDVRRRSVRARSAYGHARQPPVKRRPLRRDGV